MGRWTASALCFTLGLPVLGVGCDSAKRAAATNLSASSRQALRVCVDRWNQGNMLSWPSMSVRIAIRGLNARERSRLYEPHPGQRRCTLSLAGRPGDNTLICIIGVRGGYECPLITSDGMPPLRNKNGTTDRRGVLKLDVPLAPSTQPVDLKALRSLHPDLQEGEFYHVTRKFDDPRGWRRQRARRHRRTRHGVLEE